MKTELPCKLYSRFLKESSEFVKESSRSRPQPVSKLIRKLCGKAPRSISRIDSQHCWSKMPDILFHQKLTSVNHLPITPCMRANSCVSVQGAQTAIFNLSCVQFLSLRCFRNLHVDQLDPQIITVSLNGFKFRCEVVEFTGDAIVEACFCSKFPLQKFRSFFIWTFRQSDRRQAWYQACSTLYSRYV